MGVPGGSASASTSASGRQAIVVVRSRCTPGRWRYVSASGAENVLSAGSLKAW